MTDEEFEERSQVYKQQLEDGAAPTVRISKNMTARTHACLVGWEELESLSEKEAAVTGKYRDYQKLDTDNVMAIPQLLVAAENMKDVK